MRPDELAPYLSVGFQLRETIQYRWENVNRDTGRPYADFDEYLAQFKSKRRMQIKRERRAVYEEEEVRVEAIRGDDPRATPQLYRTMHAIYTTTVDKMWGTRYLSPAFFDQLHAAPAAFKKNLLFIVAYAPDGSSDLAGVDTPEGRVVAGTVNVCSASHFYGRYWGAFAFVKHLHFEACYYKGIRSHLPHDLYPQLLPSLTSFLLVAAQRSNTASPTASPSWSRAPAAASSNSCAASTRTWCAACTTSARRSWRRYARCTLPILRPPRHLALSVMFRGP